MKRNTKKTKRTKKNITRKIKKDQYAKTKLYPPIKPLKHYKMDVSKFHTISFWTYGNKNGKPALYVHGGPGGGTSPVSPRFFNPKKYYIVVVDQRGSGKSKPSAELRENNTKNLIADFEKIREHLGIDKWLVFGGSWGSTLSLAYSMTHPDRVTEIVLRGIFFCTQEEVDWVTEPHGLERYNPEVWDYYSNSLPEKARFEKNYMKAFTKCFKGDYGVKQKDLCLKAWTVWEDGNSHLKRKTLDQLLKEYKTDKSYRMTSAIERYYFANKCFFEPNYFLKKENIDKIKHMPITIVQGIYDMICPFVSAYRLHQALPHARFFPTLAGHAATDEENIKRLVEATDLYA